MDRIRNASIRSELRSDPLVSKTLARVVDGTECHGVLTSCALRKLWDYHSSSHQSFWILLRADDAAGIYGLSWQGARSS
jgi:hypothetical protein